MRASERVYTALREEIVSWRVPPGTELSEVEQAERWGVSRTPVREALSRLSNDGLAVVGRGRTLVVSGLSTTEVILLFELREALETQAARLAARRSDPATFAHLASRFSQAGDLLGDDDPERLRYYELVTELDVAIDTAMASPYLLRALTGLRTHIARARRLSHANADRLLRAAQEHQMIAEAIAEHDEVLAAQATAVHLRQSLATVLAGLEPAAPLDPVTTGVAP